MKQNANQLNIFDAELIALINKDMAQDRPIGFGITITEYCKANAPMSFSTASRIIKAKEAEGVLKMTRMKFDGHLCKVYHK